MIREESMRRVAVHITTSSSSGLGGGGVKNSVAAKPF